MVAEDLLGFYARGMVRQQQKSSQRGNPRVGLAVLATTVVLAHLDGGANAWAEAPAASAANAADESVAAVPELSAAEIMGPTEGERQLAEATHDLNEAELAQDDALRRAAYARALEHAERAVDLMPESAEAHFLVFGSEGRLAQLDGLATAALKLVALNRRLDEVLRLDPNHANALAARGGMLVKLPRLLGGDTDEGVALLERSVALDDESVGKRLELAEAYHIVGRDEDAERLAAEALAEAERRGDPREIESCKRFAAELAAACDGCALASIGR